MDKWKKVQLIIGIFATIGGLLIPIVIFIVSQQIAQKQDEYNNEQKKLERVTTLLSSLSSENERERLLALKYAEQLVESDMLPEELIDVFFEIVNSGTPEEAGGAEKILSDFRGSEIQMQQISPEQAKLFDEKIEAIAPRIYLHINDRRQRQMAQKIQNAMKDKGVNAEGIEFLEYEQAGSELRFFRPEDEELATSLLQIIHGQGLECRMQIVSGLKNVRARHFELWIGDEW